jgi:hypothetical protein
LIVGFAISLGGCATGGVCSGARVLKPSRADVLTDGTKAQIVSANEYYEQQGCFTGRQDTPMNKLFDLFHN